MLVKNAAIAALKGGAGLYNERRERIRALLREKTFVSLKELEEMFPDVSGMTIRRDIEYFEEQHEAIKVRGGARSMKYITAQSDGSIASRMAENVGTKDAIARRAAEFLETGRSIFIDSGSTMQHFVRYVPNDHFTFTTTDPAAAIELCKIGMPEVNIAGGHLDRDNRTVSGSHAEKFLNDINIDIAFLSPSGLSERSGFTVGDYSECELKRLVALKAQTVVILMDSSKTGKSLPYTFADLSDADVIITDAVLPDEITHNAEECGVRIVVADGN